MNKCIECGSCIKLSKRYIECSESPVKRKMSINTEQPKWCNNWHKTGEFDSGIIIDDDGY